MYIFRKGFILNKINTLRSVAMETLFDDLFLALINIKVPKYV